MASEYKDIHLSLGYDTKENWEDVNPVILDNELIVTGLHGKEKILNEYLQYTKNSEIDKTLNKKDFEYFGGNGIFVLYPNISTSLDTIKIGNNFGEYIDYYNKDHDPDILDLGIYYSGVYARTGIWNLPYSESGEARSFTLGSVGDEVRIIEPAKHGVEEVTVNITPPGGSGMVLQYKVGSQYYKAKQIVLPYHLVYEADERPVNWPAEWTAGSVVSIEIKLEPDRGMDSNFCFAGRYTNLGLSAAKKYTFLPPRWIGESSSSIQQQKKADFDKLKNYWGKIGTGGNDANKAKFDDGKKVWTDGIIKLTIRGDALPHPVSIHQTDVTPALILGDGVSTFNELLANKDRIFASQDRIENALGLMQYHEKEEESEFEVSIGDVTTELVYMPTKVSTKENLLELPYTVTSIKEKVELLNLGNNASKIILDFVPQTGSNDKPNISLVLEPNKEGRYILPDCITSGSYIEEEDTVNLTKEQVLANYWYNKGYQINVDPSESVEYQILEKVGKAFKLCTDFVNNQPVWSSFVGDGASQIPCDWTASEGSSNSIYNKPAIHKGSEYQFWNGEAYQYGPDNTVIIGEGYNAETIGQKLDKIILGVGKGIDITGQSMGNALTLNNEGNLFISGYAHDIRGRVVTFSSEQLTKENYPNNICYIPEGDTKWVWGYYNTTDKKVYITNPNYDPEDPTSPERIEANPQPRSLNDIAINLNNFLVEGKYRGSKENRYVGLPAGITDRETPNETAYSFIFESERSFYDANKKIQEWYQKLYWLNPTGIEMFVRTINIDGNKWTTNPWHLVNNLGGGVTIWTANFNVVPDTDSITGHRLKEVTGAKQMGSSTGEGVITFDTMEFSDIPKGLNFTFMNPKHSKFYNFFVPKAILTTSTCAAHNGMVFSMIAPNFETFGQKILYIVDGKIAGDYRNIKNNTGNASTGIPYDNSQFVLVKVVAQ